MLDVLLKRFRVADKALVVYRGSEIEGVRHADGSGWNIWNQKDERWQKASADEAKAFECLPLTVSNED